MIASQEQDSEQSTPQKKVTLHLFQGAELETDSAFPKLDERLTLTGSPNNPQTTYLSTYFRESYDFPWNPDILAKNNLYTIYDEMKDDDQVKAALAFKKDAIINSGWRIVCDEKPEIAEFITDNLDNKLEDYELGKSFDETLRDMLSAFVYGFSLAEPIHELNEENLYEYKAIKVRPPHSFRFDIDRFGNIKEIIQSTDLGESKFKPSQFLHYVYQPEFGNPYGKSDLKAAHAAWAAKKFFVRFFAMYIERFASPTVIGKYKAGMDQNEVSRFNTVLKTLQNSTTFAFPEDVAIEFLQNERDATSSYTTGLEMFNTWIARAILVPDLLGVSGAKTGGGSYALGETQFKLFLTTIEKERKSLSKKITLKLIRPLVKANWGNFNCYFEFQPITHENEIEYSKLWTEFMKSRIVKPSEDEINHFRRSVKFPEGPVELQEPPPNPLAEKDPDKYNDSMDENGEGMDEDKEEKNGQTKKVASEEDEEKKEMSLNFRELTAYEKTINFSEIRKVLETSEEKITPKLRTAGKAIQADLIDQIRTKGLIRRFEPEKLNAIQPRFLKDMNVVMKNYFLGLFRESYNRAQKEFFPNTTKKFSDAEILPEEFMDVIEAETFKSVGDYSMDMTKRAKNVLVNGMKSGLSEEQLIAAIKEEMASASERWLQVVVRTKTTEMFNEARKIYWETDEIAKEIVEAYEFSAILDDRTSEVCEELDGKVFEKGEFIDRITPPLHFNCRSLLVPITRYQDYSLDNAPSIEKLQKLGGNLIV